MVRKFSVLILIFLIIAAVSMAVFYSWKNDKLKIISNNDEVSNYSDANAPYYPLATNDPIVSATLIHYFLTGTIKEVIKHSEGSQIILENDDGRASFLIIKNDTRISRISLPYSAQTSVSVKTDALKAGVIVDISAEYDIRAKTWHVRDVFIPTDRNP